MNQALTRFRQIFLKGLFTFIPMALTIYILYAGIVIVEGLLGNIIQRFFPNFYIPGFGLLLTIVLIFILGLLLNNLLTASFLENLEERLALVPFIKTVYSPLKDLMNLFAHNGPKDMKSVVMVEIGSGDMMAMGLITRDSFEDLSLNHLMDDRVAVFIPFSYGLGGYTVLVRKSKIHAVNMPAEKAMSLAITGWVKVQKHSDGDLKHEG